MFGGRRDNGKPPPLSGPNWPRLPEMRPELLGPDTRQVRHHLPPGASRPPPIPPPRATLDTADSAVVRREAEEELRAKLSAFRSAVADALYEISNDYRILCNLAHADLRSCDELMGELRGRLAGDTHFRVLAQLDEALAATQAATRRG